MAALGAAVLEFSSGLNHDPVDLHRSITQLSEIVACKHPAGCHITVLLEFIFNCISDFFCRNPALIQGAGLREQNLVYFPFCRVFPLNHELHQLLETV